MKQTIPRIFYVIWLLLIVLTFSPLFFTDAPILPTLMGVPGLLWGSILISILLLINNVIAVVTHPEEEN